MPRTSPSVPTSRRFFGVQDGPYSPQAPCKLAPWDYTPDVRIPALLSDTKVDRWIEMDTYYFTTSRYLDALDFYSSAIPLEKLGVGIMNRHDEISAEGYLARFHALDKSGADWLNLWVMPVADVWLPFLQKWKSRCTGCPNRGALSCYEPSVNCLFDLPLPTKSGGVELSLPPPRTDDG